jgi:hypothetical protein
LPRAFALPETIEDRVDAAIIAEPHIGGSSRTTPGGVARSTGEAAVQCALWRMTLPHRAAFADRIILDLSASMQTRRALVRRFKNASRNRQHSFAVHGT